MREWPPGEIRVLRLRLEYTQSEMAAVLGYLNAGSVSDLERGVRQPSGPVRRLLSALGGGVAVAPDTAEPGQWQLAQIRALRLRLGLSQAEMAEALGYAHEMSVSALERGRARPVGAARRLLDLLGAGVLVAEQDAPERPVTQR